MGEMAMTQTLIRETNLGGKYVALKEYGDHSVIGSGATPQEAHAQAAEKGCKNPVVTFVPTKDMVQIY
jgi:hypothetical protein